MPPPVGQTTEAAQKREANSPATDATEIPVRRDEHRGLSRLLADAVFPHRKMLASTSAWSTGIRALGSESSAGDWGTGVCCDVKATVREDTHDWLVTYEDVRELLR
jgi:hypothetical protein